MALTSAEKRMEHRWWSLNVKYLSNDGPQWMTVEYLNLMSLSQDHICKCCHQSSAKLKLNWNLNTGIVRGLVCDHCQSILTEKINSLTYPDNPSRIRNLKPGDPYYNLVADFAETELPPLTLDSIPILK